jgi:putative flavoprotein involved in K+ transport
MHVPGTTTRQSQGPTLPRTPLDVLVIGAGQAGLAVGHHLAQHGLRFLLVDAAPELGHSWRNRWDSLRLFTPAEYDGLPGMPFPAARGTYPGKDQVADYLAAYAGRFELPVLLDTRVEHVDHTEAGPDGLFRIVTSRGPVHARQVVVATGPFQQPHVPAVSSHFDASVGQLHSADYRNPGQLPDGKTLVVGAGNSGLQIALELSRTREVHLAVGTRQKAVPQRPLKRDLFWWLTKSGLITRPATSPVAAWFRKRGGEHVIGTTRADIEAARITIQPRLTVAEGRVAGFGDGSRTDALTAVVWATGYRPDYSWLDSPDAWDGTRVHHVRGRTPVPGLWFIGLPWQHSRGSALLGFVGEDAAWLAARVAEEAAGRVASGVSRPLAREDD